MHFATLATAGNIALKAGVHFDFNYNPVQIGKPMRSTRATAAVARLRERSGNDGYAMVRTADHLFYLTLADAAGKAEQLGAPLPLDDFVRMVDASGPQAKRRMTKADVAFEQQLVKKRSGV